MINTFRVFCLFVFLCVSATPVFGQNKKNNGLTVSGSVGSSGTSVSVSTGSGGKTSSVDKKKRPEKPPNRDIDRPKGPRRTDGKDRTTRPKRRPPHHLPHHTDVLLIQPQQYLLCPPYCGGVVENEPETNPMPAAPVPVVPERSFSPGAFEPFDDPRDRWAEDEGKGQNADSGSLDYYQRMMRAW